MSKKIAVGMLAACALAGIGARGEKLNVAEGETVTLSASRTVDGGTVAGTLILSDGMTLTLTRNVFDATATLVLSNATVEGFSGVNDVTLACALVVAADTVNRLSNVMDAPDAYDANGCNVRLEGKVTGSGELTLYSTGRGFIVQGDWSWFGGTLNMNMTGNYFSGRLNVADLGRCAVAITGGQVLYDVWNGTKFGKLTVAPGATFTVDRNADDRQNVLNLYGESLLGGTFDGHQLDVNIYNGAKVTIDADIAFVNVDAGAPTLSGNGTIGTLTTWGNPLSISNAPGATLTINGRQNGDTGVLTITGEAAKPSGHAVLAVGDPSRYSVTIASALADEGWKLRETAGVYSLCRPGLCLVVR